LRVAQLGKVAPDVQQRLPRGVLGEFDVAQDPVRDRMKPIAKSDCQARESLFVTLLRE